MDLQRLQILTLDDHLNYPENCVSIESDIQHLEMITGQFNSQLDHPDAEGLAFEVKTYASGGIGQSRELYFRDILTFFRNRSEELSELEFKFFFMFQPGASNRIWMPCMRLLLSILQVNPSFPYSVGNSHESAFGSYLRRGGTTHEPGIYETWWSISAPRTWPSNIEATRFIIDDPQYRKLFDVRELEQNNWAVLIWRMSICLQYDINKRTCTVIALDDGGNFRSSRFERGMSQRQELLMREDPFSVHVLFFSETMRDWTFSFEVIQREIDREQNKVFNNPLRHDELERISRRLHDLVAYQLKYQNHLASMEVVVDAMVVEHGRFRELVDVPDRAFDRVEDLLRRLRIQAHSNYQHSLRMEKQTKNIQEQLLQLTNLQILSTISSNGESSLRVQTAIERNTLAVDSLVHGIENL